MRIPKYQIDTLVKSQSVSTVVPKCQIGTLEMCLYQILNDDESVLAFCERLEEIVERHSFVNQLERHSYSFEEAKRIVEACDEEITESIDNLSILNKNRDNISRRILTRLNDLCISALLLNAMKDGYQNPSAGFAWEYSLLRANTKYLGNFCRGLQYIGRRIPEEGQAERLILKRN